MAGAGALNLSLLSRGIGEVQTNGHEKVEVFLEPEDYYNFVDSDRYYLPPIKTNFAYTHGSSGLSTQGSREFNEIHLPKTFTTRKGALLLFSEDFALRDKEREVAQRGGASQIPTSLSIHTVEDLAKSILSYGAHDRQTDTASVYMKFLHKKRDMKRQIRPGFSAKRYLATWTRNWDDSVLETVISKGYITERSLFHYNLVIPHLRRRLIAEDLSHYPAPYRLMRSMLLSPGSLSGYTFYRAVTEAEDLFEEQLVRSALQEKKRLTQIKVIKTHKDGIQREVSYASLDRLSQEEVITDLLVKSAVHYALKKQQEYMDDSMKELGDDQGGDGTNESRKISVQQPVPDFNMKEAVESLLDSHRSGTSALEVDFPEVDNVSHSSDYGGSFRGNTIPRHEKTRHRSGSRGFVYEGFEKEYIGSAPIVTIRDGASPVMASSLPHLPPIKTKMPLTPIQDVSREQTHLPLPPITDALPFVNIEAPTPQHTTLSGIPLHQDRLHRDGEEAGSEWGVISTEHRREYDQEDRHSVRSHAKSSHAGSDRDVRHRPAHWKGSQHSSRKGTASIIGDQSIKGSVVCAPDGEIVNVGGSILQDAVSQHDVSRGGSHTARTDLDRGIGATDESDTSDNEPDAWKPDSRTDVSRGPSDQKSTSTKEASRKESAGSEQVIVDALTGHAQRIAASVLSSATAGRDLEADIRHAAELWTQEHPPRIVSRSQSVQELIDTNAVEEIARQRANSAAPTAQEYKDLIRQSLTTAVAMAAGKEPDAFPFDAEVSPELLDALANQSLSPDDIEIVKDGEGKNVIRSKSRMLQELGGVKEGHIYIAANSGPPSERSLKKTISIPSDRASVIDVGEYDVINYAASERSHRKSKAGSSKSGSVGEEADVAEVDSTGKLSQHASVPTSPEPERDDFSTAVEQVQSTSATSHHVSIAESVKSGKSQASKKSIESKNSEQSKKSKETKELKEKKKSLLDREEFVVGKVSSTKELEKLYGPPSPPPKTEVKPKAAEPVAVIRKEEARPEPAPAVKKESPEPVPSVPVESEKPAKVDVKSQAKQTKAKIKPSKPAIKADVTEPVAPKSPEPVQPIPKQEPEKKAPSPAAKVDVQPPLKKPEVQIPTKPKPPPPVPAVPVPPSKVEDKIETKTLDSDVPVTLPKKEKKGKPKAQKPKKEPVPPKKEEKKKPVKKKAKKAKKEEPVEIPIPATPPPKAATPPPPKPQTPPTAASPDEYISPASSPDKSDDEMEFIIIRDESPSPEPPVIMKKSPSPTRLPSPKSEPPSEPQSEDEDTTVKSISSKEARAAKRAAAANKRREEVERRRKEREEQLKREKEELERQEQLKREMEEERRKREEERRLRKQREADEREKEEQAEVDRERRKQLELEREKRQKEEYARKLEEMKKRQAEEDLRRQELQLQKELEDEEKRKEEELRMSLMAEQERLEYERQKKEEEELRRIKEEEDKKRREEEALRALEEARRLAEDMARRQAELELRLKFNRELQMEAGGLEHTQDITRMFVFSYFELLQWLGLDIPEFELQKLNNL